MCISSDGVRTADSPAVSLQVRHFLIKPSFTVALFLSDGPEEKKILHFLTTSCYCGNHFKAAYAISHHSKPEPGPQCARSSGYMEPEATCNGGRPRAKGGGVVS